MKEVPLFSVLLVVSAIVFGFSGCRVGKGSSSPLIDLTSAGMDVFCSSNVIKGIDAPNTSLKVNILEKYNNPIVVVENVEIMKSLPNAEYSKTIRKFNGNQLTSVSIENVHPINKKLNNIPYFIFGGIAILWIICNLVIKFVMLKFKR